MLTDGLQTDFKVYIKATTKGGKTASVMLQYSVVCGKETIESSADITVEEEPFGASKEFAFSEWSANFLASST